MKKVKSKVIFLIVLLLLSFVCSLSFNTLQDNKSNNYSKERVSSYDSKSFNLSSDAGATGFGGFGFSPDGTKMYVLDYRVYQYTLSTAWDISTASYDSKSSLNTSGQDRLPWGFFMNTDGTKMYVLGADSDDVYQYTLSTAWDVSTASYDSKYVGILDWVGNGIWFSSDGAKMYTIGGGYDSIQEFTLSTAWDVSTASSVGEGSVFSQTTAPYGLHFKSDGTKAYVAGDGNVYQYSLSTAYDISTLSYDNIYYDSPAGTRQPFFNTDGTKLYLIEGDTVYQHSVPYAWKLEGEGLLSAVSEKIHIINNSGWVDFKNDGNCTGSGTYSDPYIIKDLIFNKDGREEGICILIENTDVHFIIQNCTLARAISHLIAGSQIFVVTGIILVNTTNGKLINNNVADNYSTGISLEYSQNITISGNTANNGQYGIFLEHSQNITVSGNTANSNLLGGIEIWNSNNNTISGNTVNSNLRGGIGLYRSHNNTISGNIANDGAQYSDGIGLAESNNNLISENTLNNNQIGIYLSNSNNNTITDNILLGNTQKHWVIFGDCIGNVFSGNIVPVNKMPLIIIFTIIGCCIIAVVVIIGVIIVRKRSAISREAKKEEKKRLEMERAEILLQLTQESKREGILNCFYHPEREANTKCEKCGKIICLECKTVYRVSHSSGTGDHRRTYTSRYEYCPVCFYDQKIKSYGPQAKKGAFTLTTILLVIIFVSVVFMDTYFSLFFLIILIPLDISILVYGPRKVKESEIKKAEFLNSLKTVQPVKEEPLKFLLCPECGSQLEPEVSECSYCGSLIKESSFKATTPIPLEGETRTLNVFLSYSTIDAKYFQISKIVGRLEFYPEINDVIFWEEDSKTNIVEFMEETLDKTQVFVLFCSVNSKKSKAVKGEWQSAYQMVKIGEIKIIPVYEDQKHIPRLLLQMLNVRFTKDKFDEFIENLYKEIIR